MTIMMVVSALLFMFAYTQRAFQGNAFGISRAFGLQFDPRNRYTEKQMITSMSDEVHQVAVAGGMIGLELLKVEPIPGAKARHPEWVLSSLPAGPVPREPAFMQAESTANWEARRTATYDDAK